MALMNVFIGPG
jgi:hypothetical protein